MGAVTTVVLTMLRPGDTIALAEGAYYGHRKLLDHLSRVGRAASSSSTRRARRPSDADLIVGSRRPSNPILTMPDLEAAVAHPAPVVCDSTVATPLRLRPLDHGCDVVAPLRDEVARPATTTCCSA